MQWPSSRARSQASPRARTWWWTAGLRSGCSISPDFLCGRGRSGFGQCGLSARPAFSQARVRPSRPPAHGAMQGVRLPRHDRGMCRSYSRARIRAPQRESEQSTEGGIARNSHQGRFLRRGYQPLGIPLIPLIPLNPSESRLKIMFARGGTRNPTATVARISGDSVSVGNGIALGSRPGIPKRRQRWTSRRCARPARVI